MNGKERAELRAEAHHLDPAVHVGHQGLTPTVIGSLDDALRTRELVKVKITNKDVIKPKDAANALALATNSAVIQVIGRTATFFRENPDLDKKRGELPPWRK
ncbi:MAG TPA: YhbY family RNA-binding protein [Gemmatimonadaceae bacterium]|jgi:RNA-binding protein|nr:YhbY family RNA-binding protein [Gemmatimonadaceae bacterium]